MVAFLLQRQSSRKDNNLNSNSNNTNNDNEDSFHFGEDSPHSVVMEHNPATSYNSPQQKSRRNKLKTLGSEKRMSINNSSNSNVNNYSVSSLTNDDLAVVVPVTPTTNNRRKPRAKSDTSSLQNYHMTPTSAGSMQKLRLKNLRFSPTKKPKQPRVPSLSHCVVEPEGPFNPHLLHHHNDDQQQQQLHAAQQEQEQQDFEQLLSKSRQEQERVHDEIQVQDTRLSEIARGIVAHGERAKARYENDNHKGALISMKHVKKLELERQNIYTALGYLRTLEQDLLVQQHQQRQELAEQRKSYYHQAAPTETSSNSDEDTDHGYPNASGSSGSGGNVYGQASVNCHDSLDALYSSVNSITLQSQLQPIDIDFELDRILNTHMDSFQNLNLKDADLLAELKVLCSA